jgi:hypothetical protein
MERVPNNNGYGGWIMNCFSILKQRYRMGLLDFDSEVEYKCSCPLG